MNADQKGAWLELKELHSSLNDLKDKLNRTGQKISAASSSGPIEFNFTSRPSSGEAISITNFVHSSRTAATSASSLVSPRKCKQISQSPGSTAINGLSSPQAQSAEECHVSLQPSSIKNVAFLHHDELDFMRSLRQSSTRSSFVPSAAAITTAANVTFTVGGIITKNNASSSGLHVRKAHYINDEAGRLLKQGPRNSGSKTLSGSSRKLRRLVEKQKNVAEHRHRKAKSPQHQADCNGNHVDVRASQATTRGQSTKLVDASTCCRPSITTIATNTSMTMAVGFSEPSGKQLLEDENTLRRNSAFSEMGENVSLCSQDCVEEYLEYLKKRNTVGQDAKKPLPCTASTVLENGPYRHENFPEDEHIDLASTEVFIDPVWKRKFASLPQPKEYRGFSLQVDASTRKKVQQLSSKIHKPEGAGELPFTAVERNKPNAQSTGAIQHGCLETEEKTNAGAHPVKPPVITPTSWKKGRNLALRIHGPYPPSSSGKAAAVSEKQSGNGATKDRTQVEQLRAIGAYGEKYIVPNEDRILALRNLEKSRSVKRKAQHHMEPEGNSPARATKVRHYDAPAVRDFIRKQKLGWKLEKHKAEQRTEDTARTRELRLEKLYAFQRKTACDSARIGRCKMSRQQEDEKVVHEFVRHLKSMQDMPDFDQEDNSPRSLAPSSNVGVADSGHDSCQPHIQLQRDQEVQAGKASSDTTLVGHGSKDKCPLRHSADHPNLLSNQSQCDESDFLEKPLEGQLATAHYDFGTSSLVDCEKQGLQKQEFQYKPTEQVLRLERITAEINRTLDEHLHLLTCNTAFQVPEYGGHHASGITERLQMMLSEVHETLYGPPEAHDSVDRSMPFEDTSDKAPSTAVLTQVQNEAARKIQNFFRKVQNRKEMLGKDDHKYEKRGVNALSCIFEESALAQRESSPRGSTTSTELSAPYEEPSHHLMPDPNTIARAWKNKFAKAFLTSTRLGDELSLPSINLSTVATSGALTPGKVLAHQTQSESLQERVQTSGGTSAEDLTSLLEKGTAQHSSISASYTCGTKLLSKSEAATEKMGVLPVKPASTETDSRPFTKSLLNPKKAFKKSSRQNLQQQQPSENTETSLVPVTDSNIASRHLSGFERPEPKQASLNNDKAWVLLEAQAKALQASAETARHLAQVRAPSLLELHGENMVQQLTANTVLAASALAAALASQRPDWQVSITSDKSAHRRTRASSSSSTASQPTDAGFESIDKTSPQSSAEESGSPPTEDNSKEVQETQAKSQQDDDNVGACGSDRSASSASVSEELDTLGLSDSSQNNRISKSSTSKKWQPKNAAPLSLDSSATEDSAGASNPQQAWSQSSLSETVLLDRDLCSYGSLMDPLGGRSSIKEEIEGGDQPPLALLRLQERDLIERARADLTWIEVLKRKCREKGSEEKLPALRKRQRAILIRLHQKRTELKALQSRCLTQSHEATSHASVSNGTSVPMYNASRVPDGSTSGMHSSGNSETRVASLLSDQLGDQLSDQSKESSQAEEIPIKVEQKSSLVNSYISTFESSSTFPEIQEDSTHLKLNASKRFLEKRQQKLQDRRKNVQQLLEWQRKLNAQEASVRALERRALARLRGRGAKTPLQSKSDTPVIAAPSQAEMATSRSRSGGEVKSSTYPEDSSIEEEVSEEVDIKAAPTTESIQEEAAGTEPTSGGQLESTIDSKVVASASSEAEVSTQTENIIQCSSSSGPKSLMLIKKPLVVRRKIRRDSSGSEDSFNVSLSETASDQSDIECRIIALSQELKRRQLEAEQLKREQRRRRTEVLREREESLKKHIELYDKLIQQAKEELEKELDIAQHEKAPFVKPQIKKPRAAEQRKHRLVQLSSSESLTQPASALQSKDSKPCTESAVETLTGSSKKSESEIGTEEEQSNEASSFVSSGTEELTPKLATPSVTDKSGPRTSASSASSEIGDELSSKEVSVSASKRGTEQPEATSSYASSKAAEEPSPISEIEPDAEDPSSISVRATNELLAQDNTSVLDRTSKPDINASDASLKSSTDPTSKTQRATDRDKTLLSDDDVSEHISATASESLLYEGDVEDKVSLTEQPVGEVNLPAMDMFEFQNDTTSEGILPSIGDNETSLSHEVKNLLNQSPDEQPSDEMAQAFQKHPCEKPLRHAENLSKVDGLKEASSPASVKAVDAPATLSSLEDESALTEEVAEYTEEIVHSIVINSSLSHEEAIEKGKVDKAINSILCYLLEDTIKALVGRKDSSVPFAEEYVTVKTASSNEIAKITHGECTLIPGVPASLNEVVLLATERSTDDLYVHVTRREKLAGAAEVKIAKTSEQLESSLPADQPWATDVINAISEQLVSEAIDFVVGIAKEKGLLTAMSVESDSHKSNVSQKVSAILATIEETRNSREHQRPQDLMVLSTDLDDEEFSWKDASTTPILTLSDDAPAEIEPKELCSRAVQAEDCFLSTTSEQDWFDDDFGLGRSGDNALAYQRRIPNKPPPPYSPPKSGFMSRLFSEAVWKVPNMEAELFALVQKAAASIYTTALQGKGLANLTFSPECVSEKAGASGIDRDSYRAYCEFLFDLVKETAQEIFCTEATDTSPPSWQRNVRLRRKQPLPATLESFVSIVGSKVMSVPGLHENSELAFRNFDDQGLNFVDILLSSEARGEESEWVDYSREEVIVKDQVANAIFHLLVDDTLETLKSLWQFR
ncbi:uncharacterized protein [Dermacentor andersoni]|uniref:uncharacterized protein isoform X1 n=1 Tax=Dermacentor andersoni TaxID=34620 RepID=UPI002416D223|nr:centrosome-associated protein 350-like isoform X1 [Dermacentor andersoni]